MADAKYHSQIKQFLESKGLEVSVELMDQTVESAKFSDETGKYFHFLSLYEKLYEDISQLDLGKKLTLIDFFHMADRGPEDITAHFLLNQNTNFKESVMFSEDNFRSSFIRYELKTILKSHNSLDEFIKQNDFMKKNYTSLEDMFRKTLDPEGKMPLRATQIEGITHENESLTLSFSDEFYPEENLTIYTDGKKRYFLHMQFLIDNNNKDNVFAAVNQARKLYQEHFNQTK